MAIGNVDTARRLLRSSRPITEGFRSPGIRGTKRNVYIFEDVVYKLEKPNWVGVNRMEFTNYNDWKDCLPFPWRVPEMDLLTVDGQDIIAAEFISGYSLGSELSDSDLIIYIQGLTGLIDTWNGNVIRTADGALYIIDLDY